MRHPTRPSLGTASRSAALIAAVALAVSACGSSSSVTKASYARQAGTICDRFGAQLQGLGNQLDNATSLTQVRSELSQAIGVAQQGDKQLKALTKPSDHTAIDKALAGLNNQITDLQAVDKAVGDDNKAEIESALATFRTDGQSEDQAFNAAGIPACGSASE